MKKYVFNNTKIFVNKVIPFAGYIAMAFFDMIFWRQEYEYYLTDGRRKSYVERVVNHEGIHTCQMRDFCKWLPLGGIIFYIMYVLEWLLRLFVNGPKNAYSMISFECEAKLNEKNKEYQSQRGKFDNYKKFWVWKKK
jgi:hypothetical protein